MRDPDQTWDCRSRSDFYYSGNLTLNRWDRSIFALVWNAYEGGETSIDLSTSDMRMLRDALTDALEHLPPPG